MLLHRCLFRHISGFRSSMVQRPIIKTSNIFTPSIPPFNISNETDKNYFSFWILHFFYHLFVLIAILRQVWHSYFVLSLVCLFFWKSPFNSLFFLILHSSVYSFFMGPKMSFRILISNTINFFFFDFRNDYVSALYVITYRNNIV